MLAWQVLNLLLMTTADIPSSCQEMYLLPHTAIFYICVYMHTHICMHSQKRAVPQIINQVKVIFNPHTPNLLINTCNV